MSGPWRALPDSPSARSLGTVASERSTRYSMEAIGRNGPRPPAVASRWAVASVASRESERMHTLFLLATLAAGDRGPVPPLRTARGERRPRLPVLDLDRGIDLLVRPSRRARAGAGNARRAVAGARPDRRRQGALRRHRSGPVLGRRRAL